MLLIDRIISDYSMVEKGRWGIRVVQGRFIDAFFLRICGSEERLG